MPSTHPTHPTLPTLPTIPMFEARSAPRAPLTAALILGLGLSSLAGCADSLDDLDDGLDPAAAVEDRDEEPASPAELELEALLLDGADPSWSEAPDALAAFDDGSEAQSTEVFIACLSQCTNSEMIIGCDDRAQGNLSQVDNAQPYNMIGQVEHQDGGGDCTGTLIGDKFVLTAAHCLTFNDGSFNDEPTGFSLAQSWGVEPYGKVYAKRAFVPSAYGSGIDPLNKSFDYAVLELSQAIGGNARTMDFAYLNWTTIENRTSTAVGYPYEKAEGTVWYDHASFAASQPYKWYNGGESGILRVSNDGTGGMSGGPLYVWYGGVRKLVGVFIGSPQDECWDGHVWAARMTDEAVERVNNAMLYPPNGNVIDFSWSVYNFSSIPATE